MRKGRSVVHKNLEDNYGAVVVANHEALAQVLEQVSKKSHSIHIWHIVSHPIHFIFDSSSLNLIAKLYKPN